jgi:succinate dehydrogenase/fumarate reductase flavoprotein subunit
VNSANYTETIKVFQTMHYEEGGAEIDIFLQQDSATPHASAATTNATAHYLGFTVLPHPTYSLDLAPSNSTCSPN